MRVAGVGTGGTITGVGEVIKSRRPSFARWWPSKPVDSPVLSGGEPGPHKTRASHVGFVPDVSTPCIYDEIVHCDQRGRHRHRPASGLRGGNPRRHLGRWCGTRPPSEALSRPANDGKYRGGPCSPTRANATCRGVLFAEDYEAAAAMVAGSTPARLRQASGWRVSIRFSCCLRSWRSGDVVSSRSSRGG